MTITVQIKHNTPGHPQRIKVRAYNKAMDGTLTPAGEAYDTVLAAGDSTPDHTPIVYNGRVLVIEECE